MDFLSTCSLLVLVSVSYTFLLRFLLSLYFYISFINHGNLVSLNPVACNAICKSLFQQMFGGWRVSGLLSEYENKFPRDGDNATSGDYRSVSKISVLSANSRPGDDETENGAVTCFVILLKMWAQCSIHTKLVTAIECGDLLMPWCRPAILCVYICDVCFGKTHCSRLQCRWCRNETEWLWYWRYLARWGFRALNGNPNSARQNGWISWFQCVHLRFCRFCYNGGVVGVFCCHHLAPSMHESIFDLHAVLWMGSKPRPGQ